MAGGFYCKGSVVGLLKIASSGLPEDSIISRDMIREKIRYIIEIYLKQQNFCSLGVIQANL